MTTVVNLLKREIMYNTLRFIGNLTRSIETESNEFRYLKKAFIKHPHLWLLPEIMSCHFG